MLRRLIEANIKKDAIIISEVQSSLEELKEAWVEAVRQTGGIKR